MFLLTGCAAASPADDDDTTAIEDTPHITVVGTATESVTPDEAEIRLGVTADKPTAAEAWKLITQTSQGLVEVAKTAGLSSSDIETTSVQLTQVVENLHQPDGSFKREARGFQASYRLTLKTRELGMVGSLTQSLIDKGANVFDGIGFAVAHPDAHRDTLRADAMRDAHHQAEILAAAAGVKLGALLQVEPASPPSMRPGSRILSAAAAPPIEPGSQALSAEIEATYAIE